MITIKLPNRFLTLKNVDEQKEKFETMVWDVVEKWQDRHPCMLTASLKIEWGPYFEVACRGVFNGSPEWADLYKNIKTSLWSYKNSL